MSVDQSEVFEERAYFFDYFLVVLVLVFGVDYELLKKILDLYIFTKAQAFRLKMEFDVLLGQKPSDRHHLRLQLLQDVVPQIQYPFLEGEGDVLVVEVEGVLAG